MTKRYTQRKNRRKRARHERQERRRARREFIGRCSNCRKKDILVRRIAGGQVCYGCARKLPGHLLRKIFPMVQDPGLAKFLGEHDVVSAAAVDRPGDPPVKKTWRARLRELLRRFFGRFWRG